MTGLDEIVDYVACYIDEHGYPPSVRGIGEALGIPHTTVQARLRRAEAAGMITRAPGIPRSLRVMKARTETL